MNPPTNNDSSRQHVSRALTKKVPILYEDESVVVFDKPAGLLVIPAPNVDRPSLTEIVNYQFSSRGVKAKLHPCHRLDRDTSGAIMYAVGKRSQKSMMALFQERLVEKRYVAVVQGVLRRKKGKIEGFISQPNRIKYSQFSKEKPAVSLYKVVREYNNFSLLEVQPITGRTNQIRIQFSKLGHPLVGDRKYSVARQYPIKFRRPALHAYSLKWKDPVTQKTISVQSNLPNDMEVLCARNGT